MARKKEEISISGAIDSIAKEKSLEPQVVVQTIEESLRKAIKNKYGTDSNVDIDINPQGGIKITAKKTVVRNPEDPALEIAKADAKHFDPTAMAGDEIVVELPLTEFGRKAIQMAKQQLIQKIREAEREQVFEDYQHKVGEIMSGVVQRIYRGNIYVSVGQNEAVVPYNEVIRGEKPATGKTLRAYVLKIEKESSGPQIILSRVSPEFLRKLFEFEVPEIYEGLVEIVSIAREPGERSKIAVYSTNANIDPVGACVGLKGSRVQAVVKELAGEKIDIIEFSPDSETYVSRALAPANVLFCELYSTEKRINVIVPDDQLSLAIGTKGRNARLAAKLTGWTITLLSETQYNALAVPIEKLPNITAEEMEALNHFDIDTVQKLAKHNIEALNIIPNLGDRAKQLLTDARDFVKQLNIENAFVTRVHDPRARDEEDQADGAAVDADIFSKGEGDKGKE